MIKHAFHGPASKLLFDRDVYGLAEYLTNGLRTDLCYGLGAGPQVFAAFDSGGDAAWANILIVKDRLVSLAVAIGALPFENPEQGRYGENIHMPFYELVKLIEDRIGAEIYRPPVMGMYGISKEPDKIFDARIPEDVYAALKLKEISRSGNVAELGGGFGGAAFQLVRHGLRPTIFDLPIIGVVQGFFLMKIFGGDNVKIYSENIPDRAINIMPWWTFFDASRDFDVVFNRDSIAEFPMAAAIRYLIEIKSREIPYLSINQEVQNEAGQPDVLQLNVGALAAKTGFNRRYRYPYWIRRGYVEELFIPPVASPPTVR